MSEVGLLDTRLGLILSYIVFALPVSTYMLYSYFSQVPDELIEAARADGASDLMHLPHHRHPISIPPIVTVFLHVVVERSSLLDDAHRLRRQAYHRAGLLLTYLNEVNSDWGGAMAASLLASAPIVAAFLFLQRYFIQGVTAGAVK